MKANQNHCKKGIALTTVTLVLVIIAASCSKYQDGPFITFRKKEKRLEGTWKQSAIVYLDQNISVTDNLPDTRYTYTADGNYYTTAGDTGTWSFGEDVDLNIKLTTTDTLITFEILRLATKDLWLKTGQQEWHFVPDQKYSTTHSSISPMTHLPARATWTIH